MIMKYSGNYLSWEAGYFICHSGYRRLLLLMLTSFSCDIDLGGGYNALGMCKDNRFTSYSRLCSPGNLA